MTIQTKFNRFDPSKRWRSVDINNGRRIQGAELNEMQAIQMDRHKALADVLFGSGHVIDGGQMFISADKTQLRISPSLVYFDGDIHPINETTLPITGVGEETVGLRVDYLTVTYEDDPTLLDPSINTVNSGMPGADRTVMAANWVVDDPEAVTLYRLQDGQLITARVAPEYEGFTPILAQRTFEAQGNYLVSGMDGYVVEKDDDQITLVVEAGTAYVQGYRVAFPVPVKIDIDKSLDTRRVINETKTFDGAAMTYSMNSQPVANVDTLTAQVEVTRVITRGNIAGTTDILPDTPVTSIVSVKAGATTYNVNTDYRLSGNGVDWSPGGAEPPGGTSYTVVYRYTKTMVKGVDFTSDSTGITFQAGGDKPVAATTFQSSYSFYLSRNDVYYLTPDGEIKVVRGQSDITPPTPLSPPDALELGAVYLPPNSAAAVVTNRKPKRLTVLEQRSLLDRLERAEYNAAVQDLDRTAQTSDPTINKIGTFTDNFTNFERADVTHPLFDAMLNPDEQYLQMPYTYDVRDLVVDATNTTARVHERLVTMPFTEEVLIDQTLGTDQQNVNPYAAYGTIATIRLTPAVDVWVEQSTVTKSVSEWWNNWYTGSRTETKVILDENLPNIRVRDVIVIGEGFIPFADNIKATFDGVPVTLSGVTVGSAGTQPGTVKADGRGKFSCKFAIPAGIRAGTREVRFWNEV